MGLKSPLAASPVLIGFVPGVTVTVSRDVEPANTLLGFAAPTPTGGVEEGVTVREMEALPLRACASVIVAGIVVAPGVLFVGTEAVKVKMLSPAIWSPCEPSSKNCCVAEP